MRQLSLPERFSARSALGTFLLASTMLAGAPAFAQQLASADAAQVHNLETVVVTATKRKQDLQSVPVSVEALDDTHLAQLHVSNFRDIARFSPSVAFTTGGQGSGGQPGFATVSMRGVTNGNDGNHSGPLPTVGMYVDELPITTIGGALDVPAYDLERVEVLAGPQGTLFGASSEAGTIRLITKKPDPGKFAAGYDAEGNTVSHGGLGYVLNGFLNVPLSEKAAVRLVAWSEHDAGYIDNVYAERTYENAGITVNNKDVVNKDFNTVDKLGARAALGIDLDDNWTVTPSLMGQIETSDGVFGYDPSVGKLKVAHYLPEFVKDHWYQAGLTIEGKIGNLDLTYAGGYMDRHVTGQADYNDYAFWYDKLAGWVDYDNAGNIVDPSQYIQVNDHFTKLSNEIRVASPTDWRLRFVAGAFQESQTHDILQDYRIDALGSDYSVTGWPGTIWLTDQVRVDRDYALFTEVSYDFTSDLTLTAGVRGFIADNALKGFFGLSQNMSAHTGEGGCATPWVPFKAAPCTNVDKKVYETGETHKVNLSWRIDDARMVYATYSTGFRPGGVNRYGSLPPYHSDDLTNYEIGWKTTWLNDTLRWNGAAYIEEWNKFQFAFLGLNSLTQIANGGDAEIKGVETDINWMIGEQFTLTGSGAYNDAQLTSVYCGDLLPDGTADTSCSPDQASAPKGTALPTTPKYKANLTGRYHFNIADYVAHIQASAVYQSSAWPDLRVQASSPATGEMVQVRELLGQMPGYATFDLSFGVDKDSWSAEFSVENLFDERGHVFHYAACTTQVCGYEPYVIPTQPRLIAIKIGQRF